MMCQHTRSRSTSRVESLHEPSRRETRVDPLASGTRWFDGVRPHEAISRVRRIGERANSTTAAAARRSRQEDDAPFGYFFLPELP